MSMFRIPLAALALLLAGLPTVAKEPDAKELLDQVAEKYQEMTNYQSEGTVRSEIDTGVSKINQTVKFKVQLKKPNLYQVSWTQSGGPIAQSGAVWSDGTQPFLYMSVLEAYSPMKSDDMALASATGVSSGAAFTIPSLFLSVFQDQPGPFNRLKAPIIEGNETLEGDDCYVVSSPSQISMKETFWISKKSGLIRQFSRSLEPPKGGTQIPEMSEEDLETAIKGLGQEVNEETKARMKENIARTRSMMKKMNLKGTVTELHTKISASELNPSDFQFKPPQGTQKKDDLFGKALGGN